MLELMINRGTTYQQGEPANRIFGLSAMKPFLTITGVICKNSSKLISLQDETNPLQGGLLPKS